MTYYAKYNRNGSYSIQTIIVLQPGRIDLPQLFATALLVYIKHYETLCVPDYNAFLSYWIWLVHIKEILDNSVGWEGTKHPVTDTTRRSASKGSCRAPIININFNFLLSGTYVAHLLVFKEHKHFPWLFFCSVLIYKYICVQQDKINQPHVQWKYCLQDPYNSAYWSFKCLLWNTFLWILWFPSCSNIKYSLCLK